VYAFQRWYSGTPDDAEAVRSVAGLSLAWGAVTIYYGYRLLRLFRCRGVSLVLGTAVLVVFPCLFISSYSAEADSLLTPIMAAILYYLTRAWIHPRRSTITDAVRLGVLCGLAIATKYSGLVAPVTCLATCALGVVFGPARVRRLLDAAIIVVLCGAVGGWKYLDNLREYGTAFYANGEAARGFSLGGRRTFVDQYQFTTLRLKDALALFPPDAPTGRLTRFPVYNSVFTTLHSLAWSDMSFFSVPSRHGDRSRAYPTKDVPRGLIAWVLRLGLVADALALLGFVLAWRRRTLWPALLMCVIGAAAYGSWFPTQLTWGLKTKYVLFLLPPCTLFLVIALGWLNRHLRPVAIACGAAMAVLVILTQIYLVGFAIGRL
jgi:hypothetical protein